MDLDSIEVFEANTVVDATKKKADNAVPGKPSFHLE
jgi:hypothetical protein